MRDLNREKAVEAGADDYLIKSEAMPSDVITKIEQVLVKYGKGNSPLPGATPLAPPPTPPPAVKPVPEELSKVIAPAQPVSEQKIIFSPATAEPPKEPAKEDFIETQPTSVPQEPKTPAPEQKPVSSVPTFEPLVVNEEKPKKTSVALIIILTILLTVLVNDALMYYFFILNR